MKKTKLLFITFELTILFTLIIYMGLGIAPFGENSLMVWDMEWQYSSFLTWLHNCFLGKADWKYSLIGGFGGNTMGLISYYLSSPLNLILFFFNVNTMPWGILLLTLLKSGFMASSMQFYLYKKREDFFSVIFGCMYALSSYVICYQSNIMWMDGLILLPIIIYGLEQLIEHNNGLIYAISLGLAIICNYYIGYMLCLFSVIYFLAYLLTNPKKENTFSTLLRRLITFTTHSLLAGGLSAFLTLPTIYNLKFSSNKHILNIASLLDMSDIFQYKDCLQYFMAGSFNNQQGITGRYPLIYCGIFSLFLVFLFFVAPKIKVRTKMMYGILLFIMFLSFNKRGLYLIWHGCYEPVGSPWRFSFLWVFLFLTTGYYGLSALNKEHSISIIAASAITIFYFAYMMFRNKTLWIPLCNLFIVFALLILYLCYHNFFAQKQRIAIVCFLLFLFICGSELSYNALKLHSIQFPPTTHKRYENIHEYYAQTSLTQEFLNIIAVSEEETSLYRTETLNEAARSSNDGYLYNINTLNMYSSSEKQITWDLFSNLGWGTPILSVNYDNNCTRLSRNLSGVKYIIDSESNINDLLYKKMNSINGFALYENSYALPLGFVVNTSALNITNEPPENFFDYQNKLYHALIGSSPGDIYTLSETSSISKNEFSSDRIIQLETNTYTDGNNIYFENIELLETTINMCRENTLSLDSSKDSKIKGCFFNPGKETAYVCFTIPYEDNWTVKVDEKNCEAKSGMGGFLLVPISSGEHTVELNYHVPYLDIGIGITLGSVVLLSFLFHKNRHLFTI